MLAENLVLLRNMRSLSQEYVAEIAGVSRQSFAKWEQGETILDIEKCDRLAQFYQISLDALVHHSNMVGSTSIPPAPVGKKWKRAICFPARMVPSALEWRSPGFSKMLGGRMVLPKSRS